MAGDFFGVPEVFDASKKHILTGVETLEVYNDYSSDTDNGYMFILDGKYIVFKYDSDDGYRSLGTACIYTKEEYDRQFTAHSNPWHDENRPYFKSICKVSCPPQEVNIAYDAINEVDEYGLTQDSETIIITNDRGDIILECGTDYSDLYYPCGHCWYNPEFLPINLDK